MSHATLLSVNVGLPKDVGWQGRTVHTGIWKSPFAGPNWVGRLNLQGDGQGDTAGHGGEQRAVLVYQLESYRYWQKYLDRDEFGYGQFGENFTVDGLADDEVCVGDRYRIGEAEFEVTQPRVTCYRVGMRLAEPRLPALLVAHRRPGFYLRVLTEGHVSAGDAIVKTAAGPESLTVADIDALLYLPDPRPESLARALRIDALSPGWKGSFRDLLAGQGASPDTAEPRAGFRRLRVVAITEESQTVRSIELTAESTDPLPAARAGQFLSIRVRPGDKTAIRNYSLSSAPGAPTYRISVKREPAGRVSGFLHQDLRVGDTLEAAAPLGQFVLDDGQRPVLLISAGIGVTPVLAMLHQIAAATPDREVWWLHGARDADRHPFRDEAAALLARLPNAHQRIFYSAGAAQPPHITAGRLGAGTLAPLNLPADASAFICGPGPFMADMRSALLDLGLAHNNVHLELFGARAGVTPGIVAQGTVPPHAPAGPAGTGPAVTFARSGLTVAWADDRGSLLELAEACDVPTRWVCRTGVCHTCSTPVISGAVGYQPEPLLAPDEGDALLCCARPTSDLVLDL